MEFSQYTGAGDLAVDEDATIVGLPNDVSGVACFQRLVSYAKGAKR